jgi:hypothetical protein
VCYRFIKMTRGDAFAGKAVFAVLGRAREVVCSPSLSRLSGPRIPAAGRSAAAARHSHGVGEDIR